MCEEEEEEEEEDDDDDDDGDEKLWIIENIFKHLQNH